METNRRVKKAVFPCPVCKRDLDIRVSKKQKPYCVCTDCGVQLFVRGKRGISRFEKKTGLKQEGLVLSPEELQWIEKRLSELKAELREMDKKIEEDPWDKHPELKRKRDDILWELKLLGG